MTGGGRPGSSRAGRWAALVGLLLSLVAAPGEIALATDPMATDPPNPTTVAPSCADRFPVDGPGGLDLRLGCIAGEIVASYTGASRSASPGRISAWLVPLGGLTGGLLLAVFAATRLNRRLNRRLAPAAPASWWSCPGCRSLNGENSGRCYACGHARSTDALVFDAPGSKPRDLGTEPSNATGGGPSTA